MLQYNGSTYIKPYPGRSNDFEPSQKRFFHSTTSICSDHSESNISTSKYSFKTGTLKNIYTQKHHPMEGPNFKPGLKLHNFITPQNTFQSHLVPTHKSTQKLIPNFPRSKSQNISFSKFRPILDPPINSYSKIKSMVVDGNFQNSSLTTFERRKQLQKENLMLKKSISEKKIHFQQHFSSLNSKIGFLKNQYRNQEQKMAKITAVISEYFRTP